MSRGLLICISGIESSGKSTQLKRLMEYAHAQGLRPFYLWTRPGYTRNLEACKHFIRSLKSAGRSRGKDEASRSESPGSPAPERKQRDYPRRAKGFDTALGKRVWLTLSLIDLIILLISVEESLHRSKLRERIFQDSPKQELEQPSLGITPPTSYILFGP